MQGLSDAARGQSRKALAAHERHNSVHAAKNARRGRDSCSGGVRILASTR